MWFYRDSEFTPDNVTDDMYAFVYVITNKINGRKYVGKKVLINKRTLPPLKGKKRKRIVYKQSDWQTYYGSCAALQADIDTYGHDAFHREIIEIYPDKREANFAELRYQIMFNVLDEVDSEGNRIWYNENIDRIYYPTKNYGERRTSEHYEIIKQLSK